jgi:hypothetical protein
VVSLASASFAQGDVATMEMSRTQQVGESASANRIAAPGPAPVLEGARPVAGMLPQQSGPFRNSSGGASNAPQQGAGLRSTLRGD